MRRRLLIVPALLVLGSPLHAQATPCDAGNAGLTLPPGFCATIFADKIGSPRHLVVAPNGDVLVNVRGGPLPGEPPVAPGQGGGIVLLRDTNKDGKADVITRIADASGTGIALANGFLYASHRTNVVRYRYAPGAAKLGAADTIVTGMPTGGHSAYNFVVAGGKLYLNIGSRTNSCQMVDRTNGSLGIDPCTELETRAGIWVFDANRVGQRAADGRRYATGIRNAVALASAAGGGLWGLQHGRDQLAQNWGRTEAYSAENPAEEMFRIRDGDNFGWPYCYWSVEQKARVTAPEYGGDGVKRDRCAATKAPTAVFPGHWAPMAIVIYKGAQFPAEYRGGAFISFHGSWNRAPLPQAGFNVMFQPLRGDAVAGASRVFADGFMPAALRQATPDRDSTLVGYRPTGLAEGNDGALYVTDDSRGRIYRIVYRKR